MRITNSLKPGKIFISYRRDDSQWAAARLADALSGYFGEKRIFRDIEGITGGADFGNVIESRLAQADAVIVLIGKRWAGDKDTGGSRLADSGDWVGQEVKQALEHGMPIYPVLLEDARMPTSKELPETLAPLARLHAVSVGDSSWRSDVDRLAKIISLDIPSASERRLSRINLLISASLALALFVTGALLVWNALQYQVTPGGQLKTLAWEAGKLFDAIFDRSVSDPCNPCNPLRLELLSLWQSGLIFIVVVPASALLFVHAAMVDAQRRGYLLAAAWVGALGAFAAFVLFYFVAGEYETLIIYAIAMLTAPLMFALIALSGFKPR
ncbi:MAG: toll/interleukin-1 receptor domain-containing protein [Gammaproteobacteria bacterium]|nr:toll/interleukin-1 receptor domain-containing protein [Gammaproteobacteria bacterium]